MICPILTQVGVTRGKAQVYTVECLGEDCMWYKKCSDYTPPVTNNAFINLEDGSYYIYTESGGLVKQE